LNYKDEKKNGWGGMDCKNSKDFNEWCVKMFHLTFDELKNKIG